MQVVEALRARNVFAHLQRSGVYQFGIRVVIPDGREAIWDTDGAAGLEAVVMRNGIPVGLVPHIDGSEEFDDDQTVRAIAGADYDKPIGTRPRTSGTAPQIGRASGR